MTAPAVPVSADANWRQSSLARRLHGWNARLLAIFIAVHLANHFRFTESIDAHLHMMDSLRAIYRLPVLEIALYSLFFTQIIIGLYLAKRNWQPKKPWSWAQVVSGLLIALFLVQHLSASLYVRYALPEIETNAWWALSVVVTWPVKLYFAPYYFVAISAVFIHIAAALHFSGWKNKLQLPFIVSGVGVVLATIIVGSMVTLYSADDLPPAYQSYPALDEQK